MKLDGNTILITGGTSGIGRALAIALDELGNKVVVAGRRTKLLDEIARQYPNIDTIELDVGDAAQIRAVAARLIDRYPALNVVINNAGIMPFDDAAGPLDDEQAVRLVETNLLGPVRVSAAFVEHLKRQPDATIINNSSVLAYVPLASAALYSATKAAIHSYTLSQRFMLRDTSVRVLEIAPPWVDTDLVHKSGDPRAMPVDAFVAETLALLETATTEVVVEAAKPLRDNAGPNEHAFVDEFNRFVVDNPIPVA
ncbi:MULTISPECIES: SDR family oxidoreductase [unclassified Burkholderia]|uniref:SDR family oxidoreductase n=1 Tax=unclassified Burkholderia TaxID=2613784 RepID=UPI000F560AC9|nr:MULTISPECIES: SDR family NAD(P)-dependent oxidoreductase [unclassified Burkholderia]RQS01822.1 SDR family NAD(P)-dependent oxidoreductase [Burkholderia sp. Bp8994]RQS34928.1 SDR family NAD(P)-dependent oxidoreductase [Burkholderia sp. Bp8995]RQS45252.1 SDR family NAD(P)-dependent oxidoreductase [Burkholderia sp. Bp8990]RQS52347.1 SDR family NAD(P)-dependent oxidoreductase [Burkholderia sp. Bp8989]RQS64667.1 SDR family NAD(P)-dependent oxidoreductase [Burkholderia sp. Bp8984]